MGGRIGMMKAIIVTVQQITQRALMVAQTASCVAAIAQAHFSLDTRIRTVNIKLLLNESLAVSITAAPVRSD